MTACDMSTVLLEASETNFYASENILIEIVKYNFLC